MRSMARMLLLRQHQDAQTTIIALLVYTIINFIVFTLVWRFRGLDHVELDPERGHKKDFKTAMYYCIVTMTSFTPPGEIPPKDGVARGIIASQATLMYIGMFLALLF